MTGGDRHVSMAAKQVALKAFGLRLQEARIGSNLTQEAVAESLRVSSQTVRNWEAGRTEPRRRDKEQLAALYGRAVEWFYGEKEEEPPPPLTEEEQAAIGADREMVMNEASLALRSATPNLSDTAIKAIADFIRFLDEREERERHERQEPRETT